MVSTNDAIAPQALAEKRISLYNISWQTYETISNALGDRSSPRLTYYGDTLEITTFSELHETASELIGDFVEILVEKADLNIKSLGSTTLNRPDLRAGAEPDKCYYIQNEPLVRGRTVDLKTDPPPDLVVEIDITHTDINKKALYQQMGVNEFWRYDGRTLTLYHLQGGNYQEVQTSPTFSWVPKETLYRFLRDCAEQGETQAKRTFRNWVREQIQLLGTNG
ncbi:Uma2 family endonuclease [Phormidesmis priestleyi ULC007]|uniref:Uma2 family endonuclease n=1 Tax=Phormidesmis priestleyi ULC007 TaxID=1920490 RepID=A0A2T1DDK8_9CYAN|nr:Uma2 family endonuclease [Phormidesmis priestleyi]PSB18547.1 Uma2 family endonuclease [Phormidesmis priestleyi ULC007]PZO49804.1 MAG: Uma2 family endonuclease [Phormidesmis priestleyi]